MCCYIHVEFGLHNHRDLFIKTIFIWLILCALITNYVCDVFLDFINFNLNLLILLNF
jgi:hypothetical protein